MPLAGQWLNYPTPGIPRLPESSANLSAKAARLIERFRRVDFGHMTLSVTVDDPKAYLVLDHGNDFNADARCRRSVLRQSGPHPAAHPHRPCAAGAA
jgi:hypothetical protein